jgi:hypothetical protein
MTDPSLLIRLDNLLYRTRGRDWDYAFLLQPEPIVVEGWYALHRRVFKSVEPGATPCLLRGAFGVGAGLPFFATAFADGARRDSQARPIAHYLTWLGPAAEAAPGLSFGPALVEALSPALDAVFELGPQLVKPGETKSLDTLIRARFRAALSTHELAVSAQAGFALRWVGTLPA